MKYIKKLSLSFGVILISIILLTFITSIFYYFKWISSSTLSILKIMIPVISLIAGGFTIGKKSSQKGWLEGLKLSIIFLLFLILFNLLGLSHSIEFKNILYYLIIIISSILGSIIGINFSKTE